MPAGNPVTNILLYLDYYLDILLYLDYLDYYLDILLYLDYLDILLYLDYYLDIFLYLDYPDILLYLDGPFSGGDGRTHSGLPKLKDDVIARIGRVDVH
jgi:hypothetical protein